MILFFGTRTGNTETKILKDAHCNFCQQKNTLSAVTVANYFHLFWIKLFKISKNIVIECSHCKRLYYENEFTPEMKEGLDGYDHS